MKWRKKEGILYGSFLKDVGGEGRRRPLSPFSSLFLANREGKRLFNTITFMTPRNGEREETKRKKGQVVICVKDR